MGRQNFRREAVPGADRGVVASELSGKEASIPFGEGTTHLSTDLYGNRRRVLLYPGRDDGTPRPRRLPSIREFSDPSFGPVHVCTHQRPTGLVRVHIQRRLYCCGLSPTRPYCRSRVNRSVRFLFRSDKAPESTRGPGRPGDHRKFWATL